MIGNLWKPLRKYLNWKIDYQSEMVETEKHIKAYKRTSKYYFWLQNPTKQIRHV